MKGPHMTELRSNNLLSTPRPFNWEPETNTEYADDGTWEIVQPDFDALDSGTLRGYLMDHDRELPDFDPDWDDDEQEQYAQAAYECWNSEPEAGWPMMNYYYPFEGGDGGREELAARLAVSHLPLTLVEVHDELGLALTGGGMHFGWEICEAFMLCGELPPIYFIPPPRMAGRGTSARDLEIMDACHTSVDVLERDVIRMRDDLNRLARWSKEYEDERLATRAGTPRQEQGT